MQLWKCERRCKVKIEMGDDHKSNFLKRHVLLQIFFHNIYNRPLENSSTKIHPQRVCFFLTPRSNLTTSWPHQTPPTRLTTPLKLIIPNPLIHLTSAHNVHIRCEHVHHLALALIAPLGPQNHRHLILGLGAWPFPGGPVHLLHAVHLNNCTRRHCAEDNNTWVSGWGSSVPAGVRDWKRGLKDLAATEKVKSGPDSHFCCSLDVEMGVNVSSYRTATEWNKYIIKVLE